MQLSKRALSAVEMCLAFLIVVAHNVFHWIPNEVPILFVLAIASFRLRESSWLAKLYGRPESWGRTLIVAFVCLALLLGKEQFLDLVRHYFAPEHVSSLLSGSHNWRAALRNTLFVWIFAAFGEEIGYRGYLLRRSLDVFGETVSGRTIALLIASVAFGLGHFFKGPIGIFDSTCSGLILGGTYLFSLRLWANTIAHGLIDTLAIMSVYFGW